MQNKTVSFIIPCLNEAKTIRQVLAEIAFVKNEHDQVIIVDNGSTDNSVKIATELGATVLHCNTRGYGAALQYGILHAKGDVVVFADADGTYDFTQTPRLLELLNQRTSLVIGSRLKGTIEPGAMPWLHRYVGTPILTLVINLLYNTRITDCNSGFRVFFKDDFVKWNIKSTGMEFASELIVKARKAGANITETPITLRAAQKGRIPHLRPWRDGLRHLSTIVSLRFSG